MRSTNDGIAEAARGLGDDVAGAPTRWEFICECDRLDCTEKVELELEEYRRVRGTADGEVLAADHGSVCDASDDLLQSRDR